MKVTTKLLALACSLLLSVGAAFAKDARDAHAFMDQKVCDKMIECHRKFPNHRWSDAAEMLMQDLLENGNVAPYDYVACAVEECRRVAPNDACLKDYEKCLKSGEACVDVSEEAAVRKSSKKCCRCCSLTVSGNATIGGNLAVGGNETVTGNLTVTGTITAGSLGLAYGYVYNNVAETVASGAAVTFNSAGPLSGVTNPTTSTVVVANAGTYLVEFSVTGGGLLGTTGEMFEIFVNGVAAPSAIYATGLIAGTTAGTVTATLQDRGSAILTLPAGASITLVNQTNLAGVGAAVTLATATNLTGAVQVNAALVVTQLS